MSPSKKAIVHAQRRRSRKRQRLLLATAASVAALLFAVGLYASTPHRGGGNASAYDVGSPGVGRQAPPISLRSTAGGTFDLAAARAKGPVLLYFQEGLGCQPCWDQIKAIQKDAAKFRKLGITQIVSITNDPLDQITQKSTDEGLTIPTLSDPGLAVSKSYSADLYGMMGGSRNGHTFVLVNRDGSIRWRADYGGPPNFTMFVDDAKILAEIAKTKATQST
jgi:peroxiredoxin